VSEVIFETEPVGMDSNLSTELTFQNLLRASNEEIVLGSAQKLDSLIRNDSLTASLYDKLIIRGENKAEMLPYFPAIQPIENRDLTLIASGFGHRIHPIYKIPKMHNGIDFSAPEGTPVYATGNGVVKVSSRSARGLGNQILIDHGYGYETLFACMDELNVRIGQEVKRGDLIGTVGSTGLSVAPHLHYEVHLDGTAMNPINYFFLELSPSDYDRLILISKMSGQSFD
jgi:murein DD-endopeptidase MepM/ murein hydrolase activator NlpD